MAHRGRRPKGVYVRGGIEEVLDLGTLQTSTVIETAFDNTSPETCLVSSIVVGATLNGLTAPQGPIWFGVAHSDYSAAEIQESLLVVGSWDRGNKIAQEQSKRLVRQLGIFTTDAASGVVDVQVWDGAMRKFKLNWLLNPGDGLNWWCMNVGEVILSGTDPEASLFGHANLWMR